MKTSSLLALATLASATLASSAHAHIDATIGGMPGRDGDQKAYPCDGKPGSGPLFTYEPGALIDIVVDENIPHPSYFRIAFDIDGNGTDDFIEPRSIEPIDKGRACPYNEWDQCGDGKKSDFCNSDAVLLDNLAPHASGGSQYKWTIKLPDIECERCTLQIIQVMEDTLGHGAYCPFDMGDKCKGEQDIFGNVQDIYHRCFDLKLEKGATSSPGVSKGAVSLPADKKYVECAPKGGDPSPPQTDAGEDPVPSAGDAGSDPSDEKDASSSRAEDASSSDNQTDDSSGATDGKQDAGVKKDAGTTKKDASTSGSDSNADEPAAASSSDGCALATGPDGAAWTLLALGLVLARRRRRS